jgi:predicted TIM-barrel fold metal-dependent hydrolase
MIVDVHTHLPTHRRAVPPDEVVVNTTMRTGGSNRNTNSVADYLEAMKPCDRTIAFGVAPVPWKPDSIVQASKGFPARMNHNDIAAELVRAAKGKVIGFMSVHPMDPKVNDEYDRARDVLGLRGVKLVPGAQDFDPQGEPAFRLYARMEPDGMPAVFHSGTMPSHVPANLSYTHPLVYDRVAAAFPKLKIVLAHLGHPWHVDAIAVVRKHPNVFADVSAQFYRPYSMWQGLRLFHEWGVMSKVLFASDWPVTTPQENIDAFRGLPKWTRDHQMPPVPEKELEGVVHRDSLDLLGLE